LRRRRIYPDPDPDINLDVCVDPDVYIHPDVCIDPDASTDRSVNVGFGRSDRSLRLLEDHQYQWLQHLRRQQHVGGWRNGQDADPYCR
jgi:hypothetical protein